MGLLGFALLRLFGNPATMVDTKQPEALAIISVFLSISTIFAALRIWARIIGCKNGIPWDSYIMWSKLL